MTTIGTQVSIVDKDGKQTQVLIDYFRSLGGDPVVRLASLPVPVKGFRCYVDDATGGGVPCYADGVNWRRYSDDSIVS